MDVDLDELEADLNRGWHPTEEDVRGLITEAKYWRERTWLVIADKATDAGEVFRLRTLIKEARDTGVLLDCETSRRLVQGATQPPS